MPLSTDTPWVLVADIGGTNARFSSVSADGCSHPNIVLTNSTDDFMDVLESMLPVLGNPAQLKAMILAVAAPVDGDVIQLTNANWTINTPMILHRYPGIKIKLVNDFAVLAMGLPHFASADIQTLHAGQPSTQGNMGIIGPGTGLGVAGLVRNHGHGWTLLSGEGGHVTYAPETEQEWEICNKLKEKYGRVSAERFITGRGLLEIAQLLGANVETPQEIPRKAEVQACSYCAQAMDIFLRGLGRVAGDYALTINATSGVYIAGGIVPKLPRSMLQTMIDGFQDKGRYTKRMLNTPLHLIVHPSPAFVGLAITAEKYLKIEHEL
jgi:glucokinase